MTRQLSVFLCIISALALVACEKKAPAGFGLEGSSLRYETKKFSEPETLAEVNGQKFSKSQILDKSPVIADLLKQERESLIGLAYLKIAESRADGSKGKIDVYLEATETPLSQILARFDRVPTAGLEIAFQESTDSNLIAQFDGQKVTHDDIDKNHFVLQSIEQRRFQEVASQLNSQISRILLSELANKKQKGLQEFVNDEVLKGKTQTVSDEELKAYLAKIGFSEQELTDDLRTRFMDGIKLRREQELIEAYIAKNVLKGPIAVAFDPPRTNLALSREWKPIMGYDDAPVSLIAFSGISCSDCPDFVKTVEQLMKRHDGHLKLNWIHHFNTSDGLGRTLAEAALCVDAVKNGRALEFVRAFSSPEAKVDDTVFYDWAKANGVDQEKFRSCYLERKNEKLVEQHLAYSKKIGIVSNPTLWVEGRTFQGSVPFEEAETVVEAKIQQSGSTWAQALFRRIKAWF